MDPLLKANWKIDLIDWLVLKRTPYRKFFRRARNRVRKGVGTETVNASADLVVELSIEGALETELKWRDRKSTRLNSSHVAISYAVFCLKKKIIRTNNNV